MPNRDTDCQRELLNRALCLSLAGHHPLLVIGNPSLVISPLRETLAVTADRLAINPPSILTHVSPCPCGQLFVGGCDCRTGPLSRHRSAWGRELMDERGIDLCLTEPVPATEHLCQALTPELSTIAQAIEWQSGRYADRPYERNGQMMEHDLRYRGGLTDAAKRTVREAVNGLNMSGRAFSGLIRLARTIADLEEMDDVTPLHIGEAIQWRWADRGIDGLTGWR